MCLTSTKNGSFATLHFLPNNKVLHRSIELAAESRHSALEAFENNANLPIQGLWRL